MQAISTLLNWNKPFPAFEAAGDPASLTASPRHSGPSATVTSAAPRKAIGNGSKTPTANYAATSPSSTPAAGASGGRAPLPATYFVPRFLHIDSPELDVLFHQLRDPLCTQLYMLILGHSVFDTGEFLGGYARLMDLCTPPQPERGKRRPSPSMKVMRRSIDDLVRFGLLQRGAKNQEQGELRLLVKKLPIKITGTSTP